MAKISFLSGAGNQTTLEGLSRAVTHMYKRNGVILPTDLAVSENDTPDTNVKIATGAIVIGFDGSYPEDAYYYGFADATELVAISANVSGNSRIDAVVAYVDTASPAADDNDGALVFTTVEGTPAGSPTAPSDNDIQTDLGAGVRWHRLANVTVANGFATITNANITDTRDRTFIESAKIGGTQTYADTISEFTAAAGVTADGVLLKDGEVITDTIKEATGGAGVDVDGRLIKDGLSGFVGQTILGSPGTSIVVSGLNTNKKLHISFSVGTTAGSFAPLLRFNGDAGNNYTYTRKHNDDALVIATGQAGIEVWSSNTRSFLFDFDVYFDDVSDVWVVKWTGVRGTGSAAAAVSLNWGAGLWASNSNITSIAISGANNMPIGSSLTVIEY